MERERGLEHSIKVIIWKLESFLRLVQSPAFFPPVSISCSCESQIRLFSCLLFWLDNIFPKYYLCTFSPVVICNCREMMSNSHFPKVYC